MALLQLTPDLWIYQRDHIEQIWRLWTAHAVHVGWIHWAFNSIALMCLPYILPLSWRWMVTVFMIVAPLSSILIYAYCPQVQAYAGLSGVLHGLYVLAAISNWSRERLFATVLLLVLACKLIYEAICGDVGTAELIGQPVLTAVHDMGVIGAIGLWCASRVYDKINDCARSQG